MDDVLKWVNRIKKETLSFMDGSKRGTEQQGQLDFKEPKEKSTKVQVLQPEIMQTTIGGKLPKADKDAMKRVAEMGEDVTAEYMDKVLPELEKKQTAAAKKKADNLDKKGNKKVAQTAANPSGIVKA